MLAKLRRAPRWGLRTAEEFLFAPDAAENLAVCRILSYGGLLLLHVGVDYGAWAAAADVFWMPLGTFEQLGLDRLSPSVVGWMSLAWKISLATACLGLFTRVSAVVAFVLGFYLLGLLHSMGDLSHGDAAAVIILGVLTLARTNDAYSLDRLIRPRPMFLSGEYRWPTRVVWLILASVFFAAGWSKLRKSGLDWAFSENMSYILAEHQFPPEHREAVLSWGRWMAREPWIYKGMGASALLLELTYPLALFSRRLRLVLVPGMVLGVVGFRLLLGPSFYPLILCHVFWIRWQPWLREPRVANDPTTALPSNSEPAT